MVRHGRFIFLIAVFAGVISAAGCSTVSVPAGYDAYGFLSPVPDGDGEFLGNFATRENCQAAADDWLSRQVVGQAISAECYPVDRH